VNVYEADPLFETSLLNGKSAPETLCGCTGSFHDQVTVPPGAIFTALGLQKKRTVPVATTEALNGLPLAGGGVAVAGGGGAWVGACVFAGGGFVAVAAAVVGVAASALAVAEGPVVAEAACVAADVAEGWLVAEAELAAVAVPAWRVGVASSLESDPPQAASNAPAKAIVMYSGSRRTKATSESSLRTHSVSNGLPTSSEFGHKASGHRGCDGHSSCC